jgi:uncharacterized RDD family membrane protein YckC
VVGFAPTDISARPSIHRRLACLAYEAMLLFGVLFAATLVYSVSTAQVNAMVGRSGLIAALGLVLAAYFVGQWHRGGQTLPMRTWHIRVVDLNGLSPSLARSAARFVTASLLYVAPALALPWAMGLSRQTLWGALAVGLAYIVAYAWSANFMPGKQSLHDAICGTQLIHWQPIKAKR